MAKFNLNALRENPPAPDTLTSPVTPGKNNWLRALKKISKMADPWERFHIDDLPVEKCIRHRYNALKKRWVQDEVQVRMEKQPFNHGAMRSCFRL